MKFKLLKNNKKSHKNNKEKSRGRSMVEMLGVLAIIGVLSIGGIQGYTMAMRRYKANEILNFFQQEAVNFYTSAHQKMLNDEVFINENTGQWVYSNVRLFTEFLHKNPPSGVLSISSFSLRSTDSGDFVLITIGVEDKQLCQTIINITGETGPADNGTREQCYLVDHHEYGYAFALSIPMN